MLALEEVREGSVVWSDYTCSVGRQGTGTQKLASQDIPTNEEVVRTSVGLGPE